MTSTTHVPDPETHAPAEMLDLTPVLGTWYNANSRTWGISRAELTQREGRLWLHVWAADPVAGESQDWGEVCLERAVYTDGPRSRRVNAYAATFDLGHAKTLVQANIAHGVTVFVAFTTFTDGSGRLSYMSREFFYRQEGRP